MTIGALLGQQAAIQNMYNSSIKCPPSKVHCLRKTKQNTKDMTNAAVTVNESYQSVRCLRAELPVAMIMVCQITTHCKLAYLLSKSLFAFRNTNAFRRWGDKEARRRLQTPPAMENTRSDGADVAGIARYFRARTASRPTSSQANNDALGWFLSPR